MKLLTLLLPVMALAAAVPQDTSFKPGPKKFRLQTKALTSGRSQYDGLYLSIFDVGGGNGDNIFKKTTTGAAQGALVGSSIVFDSGSPPWGLVAGYNDRPKSAWLPGVVQAGAGSTGAVNSTGFAFNSDGLQWNNPAFGGWLVCSWWHNAPQLFLRIFGYSKADYPAPSSCSDVLLLPVYI